MCFHLHSSSLKWKIIIKPAPVRFGVPGKMWPSPVGSVGNCLRCALLSHYLKSDCSQSKARSCSHQLWSLLISWLWRNHQTGVFRFALAPKNKGMNEARFLFFYFSLTDLWSYFYLQAKQNCLAFFSAVWFGFRALFLFSAFFMPYSTFQTHWWLLSLRESQPVLCMCKLNLLHGAVYCAVNQIIVGKNNKMKRHSLPTLLCTLFVCDRLLLVVQKLLICWDPHTQSSLWFTGRKYPVSST